MTKFESYICKEEGIEVDLYNLEDVCPECGGDVISVDTIDTNDWLAIIERIKEKKK